MPDTQSQLRVKLFSMFPKKDVNTVICCECAIKPSSRKFTYTCILHIECGAIDMTKSNVSYIARDARAQLLYSPDSEGLIKNIAEVEDIEAWHISDRTSTSVTKCKNSKLFINIESEQKQ